MARFYGRVQGGRGEATRLGHKSSGLRATVQTWDGRVTTELYVDDEDRDCVRIFASNNQNSAYLFDGPMNHIATPEGRAQFIQNIAQQALKDKVGG